MPGKGDRGGVKEKPKDAKGTLKRIIAYLMEFKWIVLLLLIFSFASNIGNLMGPRFAGKAIGVAEEGFKAGIGMVDMAQVKHYALLMLAFYAGSNILSFTVNLCMMRVGRRVARNMRRDVFNKLMTLPVGYFDRHQAGDIISRVSYDIDVVAMSLSTDDPHELGDGRRQLHHDVHHLAPACFLHGLYHSRVHPVYAKHVQKDASALCQAQRGLRRDERLCGGDVHGAENHPRLRA